jgi:1-deoxyxylulose-5-phosphate synthase
MKEENRISRRDFIRQTTALTGATVIGTELLAVNSAEAAPVRTAADWVQLGRANKRLKIPRLGIGTGSVGGSVQRGLGQEGFTKLVRYAYDRGARYIDTADNYRIHDMVREAIRGLPREKLFIQTKMPMRPENLQNPLATIDRYRKELGVDYIDSLLLHCMMGTDWAERAKPMMDGFDEAQRRGWVRAKGVSCHGLPSLKSSTGNEWIEVQLARINPQGRYVDGHDPKVMAPEGSVPEAVKELQAMHAKGRGIIGMKLVGNGDFTNAEDREKAMRYAMTCGFVDAVVVGVKSNAEVDEAIERMNRALNSKA